MIEVVVVFMIRLWWWRCSNEKDDNDLYLDELDDSDLEIIKKRKIVSIDPGKSNLVYMLDETNNKLRYTTCQRRRESMRKRNNKITLKWIFRISLKIKVN